MTTRKQEQVLVIAAHPDYEVLGCGGTIANHSDKGDNVNVLIVAEGATSRQKKRDQIDAAKKVSLLAEAARKAGTILGTREVELLSLPDNRLDSIDRLDLVIQIEERIEYYKPEVIRGASN